MTKLVEKAEKLRKQQLEDWKVQEIAKLLDQKEESALRFKELKEGQKEKQKKLGEEITRVKKLDRIEREVCYPPWGSSCLTDTMRAIYGS